MTNVDEVAAALSEAAYALDSSDAVETLSAADALSLLSVLGDAQRGAVRLRDVLVHQVQAAPQGSEAHASWRAIARALGEPSGTVYGRWLRWVRGGLSARASRPAPPADAGLRDAG